MNNKYIKSIDNIFSVNLNVKKSDTILVFTDGYNKTLKKIGKLIAERGTQFSPHISFVQFKPTGCHGTEPPEKVWEAAFGHRIVHFLKEKKVFSPIISKKTTKKNIKKFESIIGKYKKDSVSVVIALSYYSTSHTRFRDMLNTICGVRYASMPLFDEDMLIHAMSVNWKKMEERAKKISRIMNRYENIEIKTGNGTNISFSKKNRRAHSDTGILRKRGTFSNLPAGEVFLAPCEGTANGTLILDWAPTRKLKKPVILQIRQGLVRAVEGKEPYAHFLEQKLSERKENRNIAELGIGINDKASRPDNILESEKILGTIHIALGDNSSFGGSVRTSFHQDFVFFKPTVTLISQAGRRKVFLEAGSLMVR